MPGLSLRLRACAAALCLIGSSLPAHAQDPYQGFLAQTPPQSPAEQRQRFHLPPGFEIQLFAAEPDVRKPMNVAFDERGRLWVSESVEYPFPAKDEAEPRDRVTILEDTDGDGRADRHTVFTGGLNIPIGIMPLPGGAVVYSIPYIYRLHDDDGDDHADRREVLFGPFGATDTHGMINSFTWGLDGWLYACHGFANTSEIKGTDGHTLRMQSGNTFRMRLDGSRVEAHSRGQVNPFGLGFDPRGDLYASDCHSQPIYLLLRGAYYPSFGKPHDGLGFGPEMCPHPHGSTAIAGIVYYAADHFPAEYRNTIFTGNVVTNRINHDAVTFHGSSPSAVHRPDFLVCDDPWFRPVDIELGPDGALYVADFYNRIIGHYEVPLDHPGRDHSRGRIWRITYKGPDPHRPAAAPTHDTVAALIEDLADPNLVIRTRATNQLVRRGGPEVIRRARKQLAHSGISNLKSDISDASHPNGETADDPIHASKPTRSTCQRVHCLWVLHRLDALDEQSLNQAAIDAEAFIRTHALKVLAEIPQLSTAQHTLLAGALADPNLFVGRAAAGALARHPNPEAVVPLLRRLRHIPDSDTHLRHTVRMALRNQLRLDGALAAIPTTELSDADTGHLANVFVGVPSAAAAQWLLDLLKNGTVRQIAAQMQYLRHIAQFLPQSQAEELYTLARRMAGDDLHRQAAVLQALHQGTRAAGRPLAEQANQWAKQVAETLLATGGAEAVQTAITLTRELQLRETAPLLAAIASDHRAGLQQRRDALTALVAIAPAEQVPLFAEMLSDASEPLPMRQHAAAMLGQIRRPRARAALESALPAAPQQLAKAIALALAQTQPGADALLDQVAAGQASPRLLQDALIHRLLRARRSEQINHRLAELMKDLPAPEQALRDLIQQRGSGFTNAKPEPMRGAKVFEQRCAVCHSIAGKGEKVGAQLDGIGLRGTQRILEDVLDPNQNVDQAFRSSVLVLVTGRVLSGLVTSDEGELITLIDREGKKSTVTKSEVDQRSVSRLSPMPENFSEQIPENELYDLLAFLLTQRQEIPPIRTARPTSR